MKTIIVITIVLLILFVIGLSVYKFFTGNNSGINTYVNIETTPIEE